MLPINKYRWYLGIAVLAGLASCSKSDFKDAYARKNTLNATTVEKQFAGSLTSTLDFTMNRYSKYFITFQNTCLPWTQAVGVINTNGRYVPGAAAIEGKWKNYYNFLAQYKELLNVYKKSSAQEQVDKRIYIIAATIFYYDQSQKMVDLFGDIPWSQAGLLSTNSGDYQNSYAKYDNADSIYATMITDLKGFADELNTISVPTAVETVFKGQDFINNGDMTLWKKYCNSLRLRILMRVSGVPAFQSEASSQIAAIVANPTSYPLALDNDDNVMIKVYNHSSVVVNGGTVTGINNGSDIGNSADFYEGLYGWGGGDVPSKAMIDLMNTSNDPRLRVMFQPGDSTNGAYVGLDPTQNQTVQQNTYNAAKVSRYNYSTFTYNLDVPGMLINAAEVNFLLSEYYLKNSNDAKAKSAYEEGISQSINFYYWLRSISTDNTEGAVQPTNALEIATYKAKPEISWTLAGSNTAKLNLIATQKWINYNVLEPVESWTEQRRLNLPVLTFEPDNSNALQKLPPNRWTYPTNESSFNTNNYDAVKSKDNLSTKIFWDIN